MGCLFFFGEFYLKQNSEKDLIKIVEDILLKKNYANINERGETKSKAESRVLILGSSTVVLDTSLSCTPQRACMAWHGEIKVKRMKYLIKKMEPSDVDVV